MVEIVKGQLLAVLVANGSMRSRVSFRRNIRVLHPERLENVLPYIIRVTLSRRLLNRILDQPVPQVRVLKLLARPRHQDAVAPDRLSHRRSDVRLAVKEEVVVQG